LLQTFSKPIQVCYSKHILLLQLFYGNCYCLEQIFKNKSVT